MAAAGSTKSSSKMKGTWAMILDKQFLAIDPLRSLGSAKPGSSSLFFTGQSGMGLLGRDGTNVVQHSHGNFGTGS
jgi:hypothetical protein